MIECPLCHSPDIRIHCVTLCATGKVHYPDPGYLYVLRADGFVMDDLLHLDLQDYSTEDEQAICWNCAFIGNLWQFGFGEEE